MAAPAEGDPERQLVAEIVAVILKAAVLDQQAPGAVAGAPAKPSDWRLAGKVLDAGDGETNMLAFDLLVDFEIIKPATAVADNLVALRDKA
jgi:hypothetical protein